ncbi:MAG TPA: methyltransferase [Myxococcaceae bacterium]|nr:methyltransferase [Myxococcaceae bacterium]
MPSPAIAFPHPDDPDFLAELGGLFMGCKMLFAGAEIGLFEKLKDGPLTVEELSRGTGLPQRSVHVLVSGLVAMGVLELKDGKLSNGKAAQKKLTTRGPDDIRPGFRLYDLVDIPLYEHFEQALRTGRPVQTTRPIADFGKIFTEGVEAFTRPAADALAAAYDFSPHKRVLDMAGGTGSYLLPMLRRYPSVRATLYELPHVAELARRRLADDPHGSQVEVVEGDALFDPIPMDHDAIILANTIHLLNQEKVQRLFQRLRDAVQPGARLIMPEHWMSSTHTSPLFAALIAGLYLCLSGEAKTHSVDEGRAWMAAAGWKMLEHRPLFGSISLAVAEAV